MRKRGYFIVIEGIDGAGKTSVSKELVRLLTSEGVEAIYTYEPYESEFTELLRKSSGSYDPEIEVLLLAADRYRHLKEVVIPALEEGKVVVMDRYYYSTIAYQGSRGAREEWINKVHEFVIKPDLAIYLDVEPEVGWSRKKFTPSRVEYLGKDLRLLYEVKERYLRMVEEGELTRVDAMKNLLEVVKECAKVICSRLQLLCRFVER